MRTRFFAGVLAGAVLLASAPGYAQDVQSILSKVTAAYRSAKSYQAQVSITETRQMGGQQQKQSTTLTTKYKAPNKMVTIVQGRESMQVYSDGKTMYIYLPKEKQYMKAPAPASLAQQGGVGAAGAGDPSQIGAQLQTMFATGAKKLADQTVGGKPMFVLQSSRSGQSQDGKISFKMTATAFIDKASYLLRQLTLSSVQSQGTQNLTQTITISFASQQINPNLPDSVFVFKPPAGAKEQQMPASPSGPPAPR
ncbi:MAG: outer membrane lipoprotein carrier protein LolA [Chthonomonadetes bacterium]|nr:outer membrane lipoprotein carrier protein LolA [Chthonomonadetes bacterium]